MPTYSIPRRDSAGYWRERVARRIAVSFPALQHRDFTLLWIGQLLSFSGSRMQTAAVLWHVSLLAAPGRNGIALGLVGAVQVVPIIVFSMLSGVVADALDRRKVMLAPRPSWRSSPPGSARSPPS